jgi:hypothetical protein
MEQDLKLLDPASEGMVLATYGNTKNLLITAMEVRGPVDIERTRKAIAQVLVDYPQLGSVIREVKWNGRKRLAWEPRPDLEFPVYISSMKSKESFPSVLDALLQYLSPNLDRDWDLFRELPGELHLIRLSEDYHIAATAIHHAAAVPEVATEIGRRIFLRYYELETGEPCPIGAEVDSLSTARKRITPARRHSKWEAIAFAAKQALVPFTMKSALPVGGGSPADSGQYHPKRVLTEEETGRIISSALKKRTSLVDLLVASSNIAIDRWNARRNVQTGTITTAMTVNMRGRRPNAGLNNSSTLFFKSQPEERRDRREFARSISLSRISQFRRQMDFQLLDMLSRITDMLRFLPFSARRRITHYILNKPRFSIAITHLGVVWPVFKNGKPTGDSYPTSLGEVSIPEVHGVGYKLLSSTPLVLIVYAYRRRLNFVMATSAALFTREEAEAFMDLFMGVLSEGV